MYWSIHALGENEQLKRERGALEDRLRSAQRQSDAERQSCLVLQESVAKLERQAM